MDLLYEQRHGHAGCAVVDCRQRVQAESERGKKYPMCYCHSKMRDGLIGTKKSYQTKKNAEWRYEDWDLTTE